VLSLFADTAHVYDCTDPRFIDYMVIARCTDVRTAMIKGPKSDPHSIPSTVSQCDIDTYWGINIL
jgi:hypothetical protein